MAQYNPPHPGEVLRGLYLDQLDVSVTAAADALAMTRKAFSEFLNGHSGASPMMALRLARAFNTTPELWMNLQRDYDLWKAAQGFDGKRIKQLYEGDRA
jgi:addiction module HigA family antidote